MLLSRRGSGVWRPLAISTGSQARPWRGGETPGRSGGLDRTLELSIRGVIPDQNGWNFEKAYIIWKIISNFHFKSSKMFKNLWRTPKIYNIIFLIENMFKQAYPFFWMQYMDNHQPRRGHDNLLTRHFGREDMQQQRMPIGICQRCDRGNRRQLEGNWHNCQYGHS